MRILSIDPGKKGAIVSIDLKHGAMEPWSVPLIKNKNDKPIVDEKELYEELKDMLAEGVPIDQIIIEEVHSMPRDGVVSAFSFGYFNGLLNGLLRGLGYDMNRVVYVPPTVWKGKMGLFKNKALPKNKQLKDAKGRACILASTMLRGAEHKLTTEGKCEAALIGIYWLMGPGHEKYRAWTGKPINGVALASLK